MIRKLSVKRFLAFLSIFCLVVCVMNPVITSAATNATTKAMPTNQEVSSLPSTDSLLGLSKVSAMATVAELTIYSASGGTSSWSTDGHAYITIKNTGASNIQIGKFTGIASGRMMSIGTWGNKPEHTGVWYNLESYFYVTNSTAFRNSASLTMQLTAAQLTTVNNYISNNDSWSTFGNCSTFASGLWNSVSSTRLSAGTPNTPTSLKSSIMSKSGYVIGKALTQNYYVYYAQGSSRAPVKSTTFN